MSELNGLGHQCRLGGVKGSGVRRRKRALARGGLAGRGVATAKLYRTSQVANGISASRKSTPSERLGFRRDQILDPSPAIKLIVTARTTAPSRYDSRAWRSTVALIEVKQISVSET
jgi:hypothetical protein